VITQLFLDGIALIFSALIAGLPALPSEVSWAVGSVASSGAALAPSLAALGPLVPFAAINSVLALFPIAVGYWLTVSAVRLGLWLFDR